MSFSITYSHFLLYHLLTLSFITSSIDFLHYLLTLFCIISSYCPSPSLPSPVPLPLPPLTALFHHHLTLFFIISSHCHLPSVHHLALLLTPSSIISSHSISLSLPSIGPSPQTALLHYSLTLSFSITFSHCPSPLPLYNAFLYHLLHTPSLPHTACLHHLPHMLFSITFFACPFSILQGHLSPCLFLPP